MATAPAPAPTSATGSTDSGLGPVRRRLCSEWSRFWVSVLVDFGVTALIANVLDPQPVHHFFRNVFLSWTIYAVCYTALTMAVFRGADPGQLRRRLALRSRRDTRVRRVLRGGDGPFLAVSMSGCALLFAALLPILGQTRLGGFSTTIAAVLAIAGSWTVSMLGYALHYAALDTRDDSLRFPGGEPTTFADYLYFAISVSTTFGTTDTEIVSSRMRRTVSGHTVIAFVFNTVTVALLVATLLPG